MTTKIPAELSSTPGISDSSNATAITIDSSENVLIGTTTINSGTLGSSNKFLEVAAGTASGSGTLILSRNTSTNGVELGGVRFVNANNADDDGLDADGKLVAAISARSVTSDSNAGDDSGADLVFYTKPEAGNYAERGRFLSSGGLTFNGDTAAANALDDYEEGTFTPTIKDGSGNAYTGSYATRNGRYTKIGRIVHLTFEMYVGASLTSGGLSGSAEVQIGGLPFTSNSTNFTGGIVSNGTGINYEGDTCYLRIARNVDYISLRSFVADTGSCERAVTVTRLDNSTRLVYGTISYEAA